MASGGATVTPSDDSAPPGSHSDVSTGALVHITAVAGRAGEPFRERKPVALGEPASQPNVLPRAVGMAVENRLLGQPRETLDALSSDVGTHYRTRGRRGC